MTRKARARAGPKGRGRRIALAAIVVAIASLVLAGCGGSQKKKSTPTATQTTSRTTTAAPSAPKPIATVADTVAGQHGPEQFRVNIYDLRRDGSFLVLDFGVTCLTPSTGCPVITAFAPGYEPTNQISTDGFTPAGVGLVDPTNLKEYLAVRDSTNHPFVSYFPQGVEGLKDSLIHLQWVRYALPPAGVTALDVVFPGGGPIVPNVPISSGAAPIATSQMQAAQPGRFSEPPTTTSTAGLTLPIENLIATSGNAEGSDSESPGQAELTLRSDVLFKFDKSTLTPKAQTILSSVAKQIKARAKGTVQVTGYTDSIGTDAVNIPLSQARARSVVTALQPMTPGINYNATGKGSSDPVAPNTKPDGADNPAGRALNRRVTILFSATPVHPAPPAQTGAASGPAGQSASMTFPAWSNDSSYRASGVTLNRDGNLTVMHMTLTCATGKVGNSCYPALDMAGIPTVPPGQLFSGAANGFDSEAAYSISGFSLLDPSTGAQYIPVHRPDNVPLTSTLGQPIPAGVSYQVWAYYGAPPSTTNSLSLVSPGSGNTPRLGPVAVSASAPATP